jgi:hypothetical protein
MAEQQQAQQQMAMQQGLGGLPAPAMEQAQFAGGGIVAFSEGGRAYYENLDPLRASEEDREVIRVMRKSPYELTSQDIALLREKGFELSQREAASEDGIIGRANRALSGLREPYFRGKSATLSDEDLAKVGGAGPLNEKIYRAFGGSRYVAPTATKTAVPAPAATKPTSVSASPANINPFSQVENAERQALDFMESARSRPEAVNAREERRPTADSPVPAAPRVAAAPRVEAAAPAAPKMLSAADFEQQLQERNKPFAEATERFRTYLQGEEATSKEEAKRDRMLTLAQAGFAMAEAASKPGATFLGSVGAAGGDFAKSLMQLNREAAVAKRNMQKELLALDQAKAANDVNMYNASLSSFMKDREFVTQVNQFNQGFRLQQAKLELDRVLGTGQIAASMANAAATFGLRKDELEAMREHRKDESAARRDAERNEMAVRTLELVDERKAALRFDRAFNALPPEEQQKILNALPAQAAREIAALSGGGGGTSSLLNEADKIAGIGGPG